MRKELRPLRPLFLVISIHRKASKKFLHWSGLTSAQSHDVMTSLLERAACVRARKAVLGRAVRALINVRGN